MLMEEPHHLAGVMKIRHLKLTLKIRLREILENSTS